MKILQVLPSLNVGGVERGVIDLARALKKLGHETVVISSGGELVQELQRMGVPHYLLPVHKKSLFSLSLVGRITEIIRREQVEVVHARSRVPAWLAWFAARKAGVPFVTTCHGYYSTHFLSRVMGWGKRVIVISRVIGRHMIDDFGVPPERIRLVYRGIDLAQFTMNPVRYDTVPKVFKIINVGRFSPIKGQVEFLKAVHRLRAEFPAVEVWLVGEEGRGKHKYTDLIRSTVRQLGLESCVRFLGVRRDIPDLIRDADLLVLSTLVPEAFGRVVAEAGACGTAVVATGVGGVLDIIDNGENGLLVPPGDVRAMAGAMLELLRDRVRSKQFALKLREKIEKNFTLDGMTDQTLAVYREVKREKKILVVKLGSMGDLILAVPSLRMIRGKFPEAFIGLLVDKKIAPLVSRSPYLDEVIPVERGRLSHLPYLLKIAKKIRREGYEISVDLQNSKWTHLAAALAGVRERYGFKRGRLGFFLTRPVQDCGAQDGPVRHQFRVLSAVGVTQLSDFLELWTDPVSEERVEALLPAASEKDGRRTVGLVVGSSLKWPTKRWPAAFFAELADRLIKEKNCRVVLIGSGEDKSGLAEFSPRSREGLIDLVGRTSVTDLVSVIKRLDALVTGDTAPLHVAGALKAKIVALFGPTDPRRHMPPAAGAVVLNRRLACQPCYRGTCRYSEKLACLTRISVEEVFDAVCRLMAL